MIRNTTLGDAGNKFGAATSSSERCFPNEGSTTFPRLFCAGACTRAGAKASVYTCEHSCVRARTNRCSSMSTQRRIATSCVTGSRCDAACAR
eukprot:3016845-Pleurochrysis_carterae.AAC.1